MGNIRHSNNASTTLAAGITDVATSITVAGGTGALFPTVGGALYALLSIENDLGNLEIVKLTSRAGDVLTVVRAQEGTVGFAFASGSRIENRLTAASLDDFLQKAGDTVPGAITFNIGSNAQTVVKVGEASTLRGNSQDGAIILYGENAGVIASVTLSYTGSNLSLTSSSGTAAFQMSVDLQVLAGKIFSVYDAGNTDRMAFSHDGTNFLLVGTNTANVIWSGITAMQVPAIELGHASDTTLARGSAGVLHIEGHPAATVDQAQTISGVWNYTGQPTLLGLNIGFREVPQNIQAGNYTGVLADNGKHIYHASGAGAGDTYTIPANASVAYPIGAVLTFINSDSNAVSIAITTDTLTLAGSTTTGTRTLAQNGVATAIKVTSTSWIISGPGLT